MSSFPINRYDEQRLIQEVHYLHSLWHQGPPHPHVHPNLHPQTPVSLQPSGSTQFKKRNKQKSKKLKEAITDSGVKWVFPTPAESSPVTESGWPSFTAQPNSQPHLPTAEELARVAGNRAQQQALKVVSDYLKCSIDDDEEDMYEDEDEDDMEVGKGEKNLNFFAKLFEEDSGLREYYEKNSESGGEFSCLVCSGVGKKGWSKRFKDCVGLVQHSITISNKRQAHWAFGQVLCRILGWDINRLPSIVLSAGGKPSESSDKPVEAQGNEDAGGKDCLSGLSNTTDAVNIGTDELSQQKQSFSNENQQENGGGSTTLEHNSLIEANVSNEIPETAKENTEGASNCPGNEGDGGKNSLSGQSNTRDTVNISSSELSQQNRSSGNENQPEIGGFSTTLESTSEANANEDVSNGIPETAKENAEGASNCLEPLQMI
ncbi:hypothetical protein AABB24_036710 [Solanum stoloniferum]|uniref:Uncharacterized protein n=1 Tax=Solanum stoloniferum TaxID=62892 RepID=A0ABD2R2K0_9SOLN